METLSSKQLLQSAPIFHLPDAILRTIFAKWASIFCRQNLRVTCRGFNELLASEEFREAHIAEGGDERHFIVISHAGEMFVQFLLKLALLC